MIARLKSGVDRTFTQNAIARNVSVLVSGTVATQLLAVAFAPVLTRLYTPEDFGLLGVYGSLLALIGVVSSLRYEQVIPLPDNDNDAANVTILSFVVVLVFSLLSILAVVFFADEIADTFDSPLLADYLWLLPLGVFFSGIYNVFSYWAVRKKNFSTIAGTRVRQLLTTIVIQLGACRFGGVSLLLAQVAGQTMGAMILARQALKGAAFKQVSRVKIVYVAKRYRQFPLFSTLSGFFNTAGLQLPPLMFAAYFGSSSAGLYILANRILSLPMSVIGSAIGQVFLSHGAETRCPEALGALVRKVHSSLSQLVAPLVAILAIAGPDLFALVFGEPWRSAGTISRWLAPWLYLVSITMPLSRLFTIRERQAQSFFFQGLLLIARVLAILFGYYVGDFYIAVVSFSLASAASRFVLLFVLLKDFYDNNFLVFKPIFISIFWATLLSSPLIIYKIFFGFEINYFLATLIFTSLNFTLRYFFLYREYIK